MHDNDQQQEIAILREIIRTQEEELQRRQRSIDRQQQELHAMEQSKVWRLAEFFRRLLRVHVFTWFPSLQIWVIPAIKRYWRRYLHLPLVRWGLLTGEYERWIACEQKLVAQEIAVADAAPKSEFALTPCISLIMPVYNVHPDWLRKAMDSVRGQVYPHWQLCIADDCSTDPRLAPLLRQAAADDARISLCFLKANQGIAGASNAALALARGEYLGLLDHDDELPPQALQAMVKAINAHPDADCLYSDEDKINEKGQRYDPFFKPDWSPDTLRSYNYLCHFTVIKKQVVEAVGGFRSGFDGSQDYDLFLRVTERAGKVVHVPWILYHWRAIAGSVGKSGEAKMYAYDSARKALGEHLQRQGLHGTVADGRFLGSYRIRYQLARRDQVAIIIPSKDKVQVLKRCVDSILRQSSYAEYRLFIVDNGSVEAATFAYYATLENDPRIKVLAYDKPFNFSAINNYAVGHVDAPYLLFLNNDTEVISADWLEEMLGLAQRPDVGAVGSLLYYPNDTVQHGGVFLGIGGVAGHGHKYLPRAEHGYFGRLHVVQNVSAVTAACMMVRRTVFDQVGGFAEQLSHAFNDVDLCLKIRDKGYLIVYTPFAELYHHESISRGYETTPEKKMRFHQERDFCLQRWGTLLRAGDPYYSPHLSLTREDFSLGLGNVEGDGQ